MTHCSFCSSTNGPFTKVEGLFTVLMCAGLDLLPTWALGLKAAANRQRIAIMRKRLAAGEQVARMYQEPGLAWLERQAEVAEELVAQRKRTPENRPGL